MLKVLKYIGFALLALVVGTLAFCRIVYPPYSWHQKMTVTVMTPDGLRSGASVTSVHWTQDPYGGMRGDGPGGWHLRVRGEAVVVDLGGGKYLFSLLRSASGSGAYMGTLAPASISGREGRVINRELFDEVQDQRERAAGQIVVPAFQYPLFVTFDDLSKPETVRKVTADDFATTFGAGFELLSVELKMTDRPATEGNVEKVLDSEFFKSAADRVQAALANGGTLNPFFRSLESKISRSDFVRQKK